MKTKNNRSSYSISNWLGPYYRGLKRTDNQPSLKQLLAHQGYHDQYYQDHQSIHNRTYITLTTAIRALFVWKCKDIWVSEFQVSVLISYTGNPPLIWSQCYRYKICTGGICYRLFFLRLIVQFFTQIVLSVHKLNKLGKFW